MLLCGTGRQQAASLFHFGATGVSADAGLRQYFPKYPERGGFTDFKPSTPPCYSAASRLSGRGSEARIEGGRKTLTGARHLLTLPRAGCAGTQLSLFGRPHPHHLLLRRGCQEEAPLPSHAPKHPWPCGGRAQPGLSEKFLWDKSTPTFLPSQAFGYLHLHHAKEILARQPDYTEANLSPCFCQVNC